MSTHGHHFKIGTGEEGKTLMWYFMSSVYLLVEELLEMKLKRGKMEEQKS